MTQHALSTAATGALTGQARTVHGLTVIAIDTPSLGDRSYVVHDGEVAFVIDPQRDLDRILAVLSDAGVERTHVFETHIHNDYVTGGFALARHTGVALYLRYVDKHGVETIGERSSRDVFHRLTYRHATKRCGRRWPAKTAPTGRAESVATSTSRPPANWPRSSAPTT